MVMDLRNWVEDNFKEERLDVLTLETNVCAWMWNNTPGIFHKARVTFKQSKTSMGRIDSQNTNLYQEGNRSMLLLMKKKRDFSKTLITCLSHAFSTKGRKLVPYKPTKSECLKIGLEICIFNKLLESSDVCWSLSNTVLKEMLWGTS